MTQEEKNLLLKDLCARLPYGVKAEITILETNKVIIEEFDYMWLGILYSENPHHIIKPYLRPMSSMTEDEKKEYFDLIDCSGYRIFPAKFCTDIINWVNEHHFDYNGLIEKGLAIEAPEDMYNTK